MNFYYPFFQKIAQPNSVLRNKTNILGIESQCKFFINPFLFMSSFIIFIKITPSNWQENNIYLNISDLKADLNFIYQA